MNRFTRWTVLGAALGFAAVGYAQAPAGAPEGSTAMCKDGSYTQAPSKRGACRGHKGVKEWYGSATATTSAGASSAASAAPAASSAAAGSKKSHPSFTPPAAAAPGGGPGMVWVNSSSNVYHCPGDKWYGKTKHGSYMSEAEAKAKGDRPDHGKACKP